MLVNGNEIKWGKNVITLEPEELHASDKKGNNALT